MRLRYHGPDPRVGPKCDVCFVGDIHATYACKPFVLEGLDGRLAILGVFGIAACKDCEEDLDAGEHRLPDLETRAIEGFGAMGQVHFARLKPWIHELHHALFHHIGAKNP